MRSRFRGGDLANPVDPAIMPQPNGADLSGVLVPIIGTILPLIGSAIVAKIISSVSKKSSKNKKSKIEIDKATEQLIKDEFENLMSKEKIGASPFNPLLMMPQPKKKAPKKRVSKKKAPKKKAPVNNNLSRVSIATLGQVLGRGMIEM